MDFVNRRESDPSYLKSVIDHKQIMIEEEQRKHGTLQKEIQTLQTQNQQLLHSLKNHQKASNNQILNLNMAIRQLQTQIEAMSHDKSEYQFKINMLKLQIKELQKKHNSQVDNLKNEFECEKQSLHIKINKLEKNLLTITSHYNISSQINYDKLKLIQDANRNFRGFSNQKQQRSIMIQNQQYANQIQYQAKEIQNLLQKNQKLQEQIKTFRTDLELHKGIENDLVKRSSLAQKLIKQLNIKIRQFEGEQILKSSHPKTNLKQSDEKQSQIGLRTVNNQSQRSSRISSSKEITNKNNEEELNKLKFQYANLKNHCLYLQNMQKVYSKKYETLAAIMSEYLQNIIYFRRKNKKENEQIQQGRNEINLDLNALKSKDVKQWKSQELETKSSLITFPESKNINISFSEPENKEPVSLPKIVQNYQKTYDKETNKNNNRFKDIPLDISTKILRSNLREWGVKINYGSSIPSIARARKLKSKSIAPDINSSYYV